MCDDCLICIRKFPDEQGCGFDQAAELLLGGVMVPAFARRDGIENLVSHFEPFEVDDADELLAKFPDLPLLKF